MKRRLMFAQPFVTVRPKIGLTQQDRLFSMLLFPRYHFNS